MTTATAAPIVANDATTLRNPETEIPKDSPPNLALWYTLPKQLLHGSVKRTSSTHRLAVLVTMLQYDPRSPGAAAYKDLADAVLTRADAEVFPEVHERSKPESETIKDPAR